MITQAPQKEFTLAYSLLKVKETIASTLRLAGQRFLNKNDILNTYRLSLIYGLYTAIVNIQLTEVEDNKTLAVFEVLDTPGTIIQPSTLIGMLDKYLETFTALLTGKTKIVEKTPDQIAKENKKRQENLIYVSIGGLVVVVVVIYFLTRA